MTGREIKTFSQRTQLSLQEALEGVAELLMVARPIVKETAITIETFTQSLDFDISRLNHAIDVESWKDQRDMDAIEDMTRQRDEIVVLRSHVEDGLGDRLIHEFSSMMDALRKVEKVLQEDDGTIRF